MMTDKLLGTLASTIAASAATYTAPNSKSMIVRCVGATNAVIESIALVLPETGFTPATDAELVPGNALYGVKSFALVSGTVQIFFV